MGEFIYVVSHRLGTTVSKPILFRKYKDASDYIIAESKNLLDGLDEDVYPDFNRQSVLDQLLAFPDENSFISFHEEYTVSFELDDDWIEYFLDRVYVL